MADAGFSKTQLKQLETLFDKNNKQVGDAVFHVVNTLSNLIQDTRSELNEKIELEVKSLRRNIGDDLKSLTTTFATKYEFEELRKKIGGVSSAHD